MKTCRKQRRQRKKQSNLNKLQKSYWSPVSCPMCRYQGSIIDSNNKFGDIWHGLSKEEKQKHWGMISERQQTMARKIIDSVKEVKQGES